MMADDTLGAAPPSGTGAGPSFNPGMFGDLIGVVGRRVIITPPGVTPNGFVRLPSVQGNLAIAVAPLPVRTAFKITENESPRPTNRVYFTYNYFNNVNGFGGFSGIDLHREIIGGEYVILGGNGSIGMRLPFFQLRGNNIVEDSEIGNLTTIFKYAWINDRETGNVLSTGLVLTTPTGPGLQIPNQSTLNPWVFQPFLGYIYSLSERCYVQGFSSIAVPTDTRDVTILFNSVGVGYWAYRPQPQNECGCQTSQPFLKGIIPMAEFHLNTPLNNRGLDNPGPIVFSDSLNFTGGCYIYCGRAVIGAAFGVPLTGPKPYDYEAAANIGFYW